jgi:hypothetical protein
MAFVDQAYRRRLVEVISKNLFSPQAGLEQTEALFKEIKAIPKTTPFLEGLALDLVDPHPNHGQVSKAFQPSFFPKWGKDYLRSHRLFHIAEQCGNFKDESLHGYSGPKFGEYRALGNTIFVNLPRRSVALERAAVAAAVGMGVPLHLRQSTCISSTIGAAAASTGMHLFRWLLERSEFGML